MSLERRELLDETLTQMEIKAAAGGPVNPWDIDVFTDLCKKPEGLPNDWKSDAEAAIRRITTRMYDNPQLGHNMALSALARIVRDDTPLEHAFKAHQSYIRHLAAHELAKRLGEEAEIVQQLLRGIMETKRLAKPVQRAIANGIRTG